MLENTTAPAIDDVTSLNLLRALLRVRFIEERTAELYAQEQLMRCPTHFSLGQEAVAVGVCAHLTAEDQITSAHRSHAHYLAKGGNLPAMIAELYGKATGCSHGKGGSMHLIDQRAGFLGAVPIVGSTIPIGVGAAFASVLQNRPCLSVIFFGEGATETGVFHESLNFAAIQRLPVVMVCENNFLSVNTPMEVRHPQGREIISLAQGHGIRAVQADGNDVEAVFHTAHDAIHRARHGQGPVFLEYKTYRWLEHCGPLDDCHLGYRSREEMDSWKRRDPLLLYREKLIRRGVVTDEQIQHMLLEIRAEMDEALAFARNSPFPPREELTTDLYASEVLDMAQRTLKFFEAIHEALDLALERDPRVYVMGLGVPDPIGVFGTTRGLVDKHGSTRVMDMPISESAMTGVAIGSALRGMKPVMTHMRLEFALLAIDQIVNQAAKWHYMFGGQAKVPLVIRMIVGRGWGQGPQHSQSLQAWFAHIPGLRVVMPATPHDAKGLLLAAIEDNNPVVFIEHRWLYNLYGPVPEGYYTTALDQTEVIHPGRHVTVAACSYMTIEALRAATELQKEGIELEVIDIKSLNPFDESAIVESVRKTGLLLVADTGSRSVGFAAEVVARVCEQALGEMKKPPVRVTSPDLPTPTTRALANYYYPTSTDLASAARQLLGREAIASPAVTPEAFLDAPHKDFMGPF